MPFGFGLLGRALRLTFTPGRFHPLHALFVVLLVLVFAVFFALVAVARAFDQVLFPAYRRTAVERPLFIVANPRSGTTFLHRLLSLDRRFTHFRLWHTILPSVGLYRVVGALAAVDRRVGRPLGRLIGLVNRLFFGGWDGIHATGFDREEEDVMLQLYTLYNPAFTILFPWYDDFPEAVIPDSLPPARRSAIARYYRDCLQRHVHATASPEGPRTLLNKNVLLGGATDILLEALPDVRLVYLVRHPYEAVPSMLNMFWLPWQRMAPQIRKDGPEIRAMAEALYEFYRRWEAACDALPESQVLRVRYDDLVADPEATVRRLYGHFDLPLTAEYEADLRAVTEASRHYRSEHSYTLAEFGLTPADVQAAIPDIFERYGFERDPAQAGEKPLAAAG